MEPEFLDPGPDQPGQPGRPGHPGPPTPGVAAAPLPRPFGSAAPHTPAADRPARRESVGLLLMLVAATILPVVAARQTLYTVVEQNVVSRESFAVSAWGDYEVAAGEQLAGHAPRFGILLTLGGAAFGLLALMTARLLLGARTERGDRTSLGIAAAATGLVGLQVGVTAAMTLQIQSSFAGYEEAAGVLEVRLQVGGAVWLSLAAVLAGGLAVMAALRVRRAFRGATSGY